MWISATPYTRSLTGGIRTSQVHLHTRSGWWLTLHDVSGEPLGVGEVAPWKGFGAGPEAVARELNAWDQPHEAELRAYLLDETQLPAHWGDPAWIEEVTSAEELSTRLAALEPIRRVALEVSALPEVRCGVELAILDALARQVKRPLCQLLDPRAPLSAPTHAQVKGIEGALYAARQGYRVIKLKVGARDHWTTDLAEVARIRATLPEIGIRLDVNQGWSPLEARGALIAARGYGVDWVEEPCALDDYPALWRALKPEHTVSIGLDESLSDTELIGLNTGLNTGLNDDSMSTALSHAVQVAQASVVVLKPMALGGLLSAARVARSASALGLRVSVTHTLGSAVERAAAAHLSAALRPSIQVEPGGLGGALEDDLMAALPVYGGELRLSTGAGLDAPLLHFMSSLASLSPTQSAAQKSQAESQTESQTEYQTEYQEIRSALPHPLEAARRARPDHVALESAGGERLSYSQLYEATRILKRDLLAAGVSGDHVVGLSGSLTPEWVITLHALTAIGARVALLNPQLTDTERARALAQTEAHRLISIDELTLSLSQVSSQDDSRDDSQVQLDLASLKTRSIRDAQSRIDEPLDPWRWDEPLFMIYTSGSTGAPQVILLTPRQLCLSAFGSAIRLGHALDDAWLACLPPYHVGGLSILTRCLWNQITVKLCPPRVDAIASALASGEVSLASLTPTLLSGVIDQLSADADRAARWRNRGQARLRAILIGGGPTSEALWERAQTLNLPIRLTWGMSETASQVCTQVESAPPQTSLAPLPFALVDLESSGRLRVSGPLTPTGTLTTGDLGRIDERGVYITGRADDLIISGGLNIDPREIEEVLALHPAVSEVAVVSVPHVKYGSRPVAVLTPALDVPQTPQTNKELNHELNHELNTWCRARLSAYKRPDALIWLDELPRSALGKLKRGVLRDLARRVSLDHMQSSPLTGSMTESSEPFEPSLIQTEESPRESDPLAPRPKR